MAKKLFFLFIVAILITVTALLFRSLSEVSSGEKSTTIEWLGEGQAKVGQRPPNFRLPNIEGQNVELLGRNKITILNFWASWCAPCLEEIPGLFSLVNENPDNFEIIAISEDDSISEIRKALRAFPSMSGSSIQVILDPHKMLMKKFGVTGVPETFVIGPDGLIQQHIIGKVPESFLRLHRVEGTKN